MSLVLGAAGCGLQCTLVTLLRGGQGGGSADDRAEECAACTDERDGQFNVHPGILPDSSQPATGSRHGARGLRGGGEVQV
ncbi:hypothetical protein A6A29_16560 [Streptomyces sp. TSRI0281]|nr:hypothetical protein A6A29_16560 [Streptomyces sp. TSRI0281]